MCILKVDRGAGRTGGGPNEHEKGQLRRGKGMGNAIDGRPEEVDGLLVRPGR